MTVEEVKQGKTKDQLAARVLELLSELDTEQQISKALDKTAGLLEGDIEKLQVELETAECKLKVVEEASRAGLAMLYPDAPIPSRNSDSFGYGDGMMHGTARLVGEEPSPQERLIVHILQEAI